MAKEIERKWLMNDFPDFEPIDGYEIFQGYISLIPEVRIRSKRYNLEDHLDIICGLSLNNKTNYRLCIKSQGDLTRTEVEKDLTESEYDQLSELLMYDMINKNYKIYEFEGYLLEVSRVNYGEFYYVEIEFESEEEANNFIAPEWFGKEITYDKNYKMKNYFARKED